jgi:hypothetical protein
VRAGSEAALNIDIDHALGLEVVDRASERAFCEFGSIDGRARFWHWIAPLPTPYNDHKIANRCIRIVRREPSSHRGWFEALDPIYPYALPYQAFALNGHWADCTTYWKRSPMGAFASIDHSIGKQTSVQCLIESKLTQRPPPRACPCRGWHADDAFYCFLIQAQVHAYADYSSVMCPWYMQSHHGCRCQCDIVSPWHCPWSFFSSHAPKLASQCPHRDLVSERFLDTLNDYY